MAKAFFIGLGGCGLKTVSELQEKLAPENQNRDYLFTYIDTDEKTKDQVNHDKIIIHSRDFVNIGDTNPLQEYNNAVVSHDKKSDRLKEWAIEQGIKGHLTFPNEKLSDGAQAIRMFGRCGLYRHEQVIKSVLKERLSTFQTLNAEENKTVKPSVWVFASSCGGTGSSMTLDILYFINRIVLDELKLDTPDVKLVLFMPQPFINKNEGNMQYYLNAYAYMWEINAFRLSFQNNERDQFGKFAAVPPQADWNDEPFELFKYIIPVDTESDLRNKIDVDDLYPTVAEMVYFLNKGNVSNQMISNLSNDQHLLNGDITKHTDTRCLWTTPLIAYGYRAIKKTNQELIKYLRTRGMSELVKYGLLGEDIPDEDREEVSQAFAKKYILPYLIDIEGISTANNRSLKTYIEEVYDEPRLTLRADGLHLNQVTFNLNEVAINKDSKEINKAKKEVYDSLKRSINQGVSEIIRTHGLIYAKTLLNLVDDSFLEPLIDNKLSILLRDKKELADAKRAQCETYKKLDKKSAPLCVASYEEYRRTEAEAQMLTAAIELIESLTRYPSGYLEELRKGTNDKVGLQALINKSNEALGLWESAFEDLAREFKSAESNAFTTYIPSLKAIAHDEDTQWPTGTLFDILYSNSILDYDRALADKRDGQHIPLHISTEGHENCISYYLQAIDKNNDLFIKLAQMDRFKLSDQFERKVLDSLSIVLNDAIKREGSQASKWIDIPLAEALKNPDFLPANIPAHKFFNQLGSKDSIHVLYPTTNRNTVAAYRYIYAGASKELAGNLYNGQGEDALFGDDAQFIEDAQMKDRFLIMKMPLGYDFYSYSHFAAIERIFNENYSKIRSKAKEGGCFIHQAFIGLDIKTQSLQTLMEALYFQAALKLIGTKKKGIYNEIFGKLDFSFAPEVQEVASASEAGDFMSMFSNGSEASSVEAGTNVLDIDSSVTDDNFLSIKISKPTDSWIVEIITKEVEIDNDGILQIGALENRFVLEKKSLLSAELFSNGIGPAMGTITKMVNTFRQLKKNDRYRQAFEEVFQQAKNSVLEMGTTSAPKFAMFIRGWMSDTVKNGVFIKAMTEVLNSMAK